jgi:hypothetical protein
MSFTSIQMLVSEIHRLLRDHVGEIRVAEYCEACMTQDTNRLLYVGHAVDMGSVGGDTVPTEPHKIMLLSTSCQFAHSLIR